MQAENELDHRGLLSPNLPSGFAAVKKRVHPAAGGRDERQVSTRCGRQGNRQQGVRIPGSRRLRGQRCASPLVAFIVLRIAFGSGGNADQSGALGDTGQATRRDAHVMDRGGRHGGAWRCGTSQKRSSVSIPASGRSRSRTVKTDRRGSGPKTLGVAILYFAIALLGGTLRDGQRTVQRSAELGHVRAADAVRLGQDPVDRGRAWRRGRRRLPRLQGRVEEVPEGPAGLRRDRRSPRSVSPATWPRASSSSAPGCSSSSLR